MEAARFGREGVVELLFDQPTINLEARDQEGRTALLLAAAGGNPQVVQLLLARGQTRRWWTTAAGPIAEGTPAETSPAGFCATI